jgi:hypothetical protein
VLILLLALAAFPATARADKLELARVCYFEARFSLPDCAAIFHVIAKRAEQQDRPFVDMLRAYSKLYEGTSQRKIFIRAFPWGDLSGESESFQRSWMRLRMYALTLLLGVVPDPCPKAIHWGGRSDPQPAGFVEVECSRPVQNRMYRIERGDRRSHSRVTLARATVRR